jgi:hypothetical protein
MSIRNDLVLFSARGCQVPASQSSRIGRLTVADGDRYVVSFANTQEGIYTSPELPAAYQGGTLKVELICIASESSGTAGFSAAVEAITPGDATDLDSTVSFDTANDGTGSVPSTVGQSFLVTITLSNKDSAAAGDHFRLKLVRSDSVGGTIWVVGAKLYEDVASIDLTGVSNVQVTALNSVPAATIAYLDATSSIQTQLDARPKIYRTTLTNPSTSTVTITHNLGQTYVQVTVYDENGNQILPDEVTPTNSNSLVIDKTTYGTVTGTWRIVVVG